jgi:hypothetical protein
MKFPQGRKLILVKWIFKIKESQNKHIIYEACLVA